MTNLKSHIICAFGSLICTTRFHGQGKLIKKDTSNVDVTYFKDAIKERYQGDEFNYDINDSGGVNLIQKVLRKFFGWLGDLFGVDIDFVDYKTLEYCIYGLLGLGAFYLLIKFLMQSPVRSVFKTSEKDIDSFKYVEENLTEINFDDLISKALKEGNYRLATRYLYLSTLKLMTKNNIIDWHFDKTNSDYVKEIQNETIQQGFKRISYIYDYVWYGEFPIDKVSYDANRQEFQNLLKAVRHG